VTIQSTTIVTHLVCVTARMIPPVELVLNIPGEAKVIVAYK
jgi:hypothetical protein